MHYKLQHDLQSYTAWLSLDLEQNNLQVQIVAMTYKIYRVEANSFQTSYQEQYPTDSH